MPVALQLDEFEFVVVIREERKEVNQRCLSLAACPSSKATHRHSELEMTPPPLAAVPRTATPYRLVGTVDVCGNLQQIDKNIWYNLCHGLADIAELQVHIVMCPIHIKLHVIALTSHMKRLSSTTEDSPRLTQFVALRPSRFPS